MYNYNEYHEKKFYKIKRFNCGDIVLFKVAQDYVSGKIIARLGSCYMIIVDGLRDGRWDDGIFRVGVWEVEKIRSFN